MTLSADGWFDFAIRDPGPTSATNGGLNGGLGLIPHSAEGDWDSLQALHDFHWGRATAAPGKRASWGATNLKDGRFVQHYSIWAQTWTSGALYPNDNFFAFENEGRAGEPLTQAQIDNIIRVGRDLMAVQKWEPRRPVNSADKTASLYEHCETPRWGGAATACPSGRIPWNIIVPALKASEEKEEDDMPAVVWNTDLKTTQLVGFHAPIIIGSAAEVAELEKKYGKQIALSDQTIKQMHP